MGAFTLIISIYNPWMQWRVNGNFSYIAKHHLYLWFILVFRTSLWWGVVMHVFGAPTFSEDGLFRSATDVPHFNSHKLPEKGRQQTRCRERQIACQLALWQVHGHGNTPFLTQSSQSVSVTTGQIEILKHNDNPQLSQLFVHLCPFRIS